jgi:uncharacterized protein YdhG (YjbR/CyaY superfamily)
MFLDETSFQLRVEEICRTQRLDYMDAVLKFCTENDLEPEDIKKLVTVNLKDKIRNAAIEQGLMRPISQLPL